MRQGTLKTKWLAGALAVSIGVVGCDPESAESMDAEDDFSVEVPDESEGKADGGVLSIPVAIYYVGAILVAAIAGVVVYQSQDGELADIVGDAVASWQFEQAYQAEVRDHAAYLDRAMNRVAYYNHSFGGYPVTATDFVVFINSAEQISVETSVSFGSAAREFMRSARIIATKTRHEPEYRDGGCVVAKVKAKESGAWFEGRARYFSPEDVLAAVAAASMQATARCGSHSPDVVEALQAAIPDNSPPSFSIDTFIEYGWKSVNFVWAYNKSCQLPPSLAVTKDPSGC